jgi:hypothetical protein
MLRCVSRYRSSLGAFAVGDIVESAELEAALLADSPLSFELVGVEVVTTAPEAPPEDKIIRRRK